MSFLIILLVALAVSSIGFKKYIWFISIGYGSSIAAIGLAMLILFHGRMDPGLVAACVVLIVYGSFLFQWWIESRSKMHSLTFPDINYKIQLLQM